MQFCDLTSLFSDVQAFQMWNNASQQVCGYSGVSKLDLAVAQVTAAVAPCVVWRAAPFITKNEK